ncbi:MAG: molybdate ABC transporter substrate-binding protein [Beijerinckiaceae bacterium]
MDRLAGILLWGVVFMAQSAVAAEIKLLAPGALRSTLNEVAPLFQKESGHSLSIAYAAAGPLAARVRKGEAADAAILSRAEIYNLRKEGLIRDEPTPDVARVGIGIMVRKGAPRPDISTLDSLQSALRTAKTIGIADPAQGAAGAHLMKTFASWGMINELSSKIRALPPGDGLYAGVETGEAEIGFAPISEILARRGTLDLIGPAPSAIQNYNRFAAGVLTSSREPEAATALITFLSSARIDEVLRKNGLEPR